MRQLEGIGRGAGRRGLLAGAAALIGAGLARLSGPDRAEAGHNTPGIGVTNGVWGENLSTATNATGVFGLAALSSGATVGVWGRSNSTNAGAVGTLGEVTATGAAGIGVKGTSINGPGVYGTSTTAFGVQ